MPRKPATVADDPGSKSARTRDRILDAAAHVLSRKGYAGTRLTDVADRAAIQAPAIYYYFPSRDDLIEEKYRGMGFGRQTMEFVADRARELGVNVIHLEVDRGNEPALALYRRTGYVDHDRYLMTKWLRHMDS